MACEILLARTGVACREPVTGRGASIYDLSTSSYVRYTNYHT